MIDLPEIDGSVHFVLLSGGGDRLYTVADQSLLVYSLSEFANPLASYPIGGNCYAGVMIDSRLYLGDDECKLHVFEVTSSLTQPIEPITQIKTERAIFKFLKEGN